MSETPARSATSRSRTLALPVARIDRALPSCPNCHLGTLDVVQVTLFTCAKSF